MMIQLILWNHITPVFTDTSSAFDFVKYFTHDKYLPVIIYLVGVLTTRIPAYII